MKKIISVLTLLTLCLSIGFNCLTVDATADTVVCSVCGFTKWSLYSREELPGQAVLVRQHEVIVPETHLPAICYVYQVAIRERYRCDKCGNLIMEDKTGERHSIVHD